MCALTRRAVQKKLHGSTSSRSATANLRTKILDVRGFDSSIILIVESHVGREIPGKLESSNLSREILRREIGRRLLTRQNATSASASTPLQRPDRLSFTRIAGEWAPQSRLQRATGTRDCVTLRHAVVHGCMYTLLMARRPRRRVRKNYHTYRVVAYRCKTLSVFVLGFRCRSPCFSISIMLIRIISILCIYIYIYITLCWLTLFL